MSRQQQVLLRKKPRMVLCVCRHSRELDMLPATSPQVQQDTRALLACSSCPACHRGERQAVAIGRRDAFGLVPLEGQDALQNGLAEEVRLHLLEMLSPTLTVEALPALLAVLNLQHEATFWLERRAILWSSNKQQMATVLLDLLQSQEG